MSRVRCTLLATLLATAHVTLAWWALVLEFFGMANVFSRAQRSTMNIRSDCHFWTLFLCLNPAKGEKTAFALLLPVVFEPETLYVIRPVTTILRENGRVIVNYQVHFMAAVWCWIVKRSHYHASLFGRPRRAYVNRWSETTTECGPDDVSQRVRWR